MMTHGNVLATGSGVLSVVPTLRSNDVYLAYLPLAHILELIAETILIAAGISIGYGSPLTLTDTTNKIKRGTKGDASELGPTLMTAVPAILDRVRDGVRKKVDTKGGIAKKLFDVAYGRRLYAINGSWFGASHDPLFFPGLCPAAGDESTALLQRARQQVFYLCRVYLLGMDLRVIRVIRLVEMVTTKVRYNLIGE